MLHLKLKRGKNLTFPDGKYDHAPGILTVGDEEYYTCEDVVREIPGVPVDKWKIYGKTAIPRGTYEVKMTWSNRFKATMPELIGVPGFTGIRIHSANYANELEGCIAPGMDRMVAKNIGAIGVARSREAMVHVQRAIDAELKKPDGKVVITVL